MPEIEEGTHGTSQGIGWYEITPNDSADIDDAAGFPRQLYFEQSVTVKLTFLDGSIATPLVQAGDFAHRVKRVWATPSFAGKVFGVR